MGRPRIVLILALLFSVAAAVAGAPVAERMSNSPADFDAPGAESADARRALSEASGASPGADVVALVRPGMRVGSPAGRTAVESAAEGLAADPGVGLVETPFGDVPGGGGNPALVSEDGRSALVVGHLRPGADEDRAAERLLKRFDGDGEVLLGGEAVAGTQFGTTSAEDIKRAELLAFPLLFALALIVYRGLVAALLPVLVGAVAVLGSLLGLRLAAEVVPLSAFALNAVTGLGLGLAIDYSLLILSRYREEVAAGDNAQAALRTTMRTAGRTVLHSSLTVAASLAALLVFPQRFLYSVGVGGGVLVSLLAASAPLLVLPALIAVLGPRLEALPFRLPLGSRGNRIGPGSRSEALWSGLAGAVMRRPATFAVAATAVLLIAALPALGLRFTSVDGRALPEDLSARQVSDAVEQDFSRVAGAPLHIAVGAPGGAADRQGVEDLARSIGELPGAEAVAPPVRVGDGLWRIDASADGEDPFGRGARELVRAVRGLDAPYTVEVSGPTARFEDQLRDMASRLPVALAVALAANLAVLFAATGSLVLPVKQFLMNTLTVAATFGVLAWIFRWGHLEGLLGFDGLGAVAHTTLPVVVILAFALGTDYGLFLLARIRELRNRGAADREAIAEALGRTGPTVTAAAVLFAVALGAFATSEVVFVKEVGIGAALAVLIDATVVRALLVPSLMTLLGRVNWWAPRFSLSSGRVAIGRGRKPLLAGGRPLPPAVEPHPSPGPSSITVDLDCEQHRTLERFALGRDVEGTEVVRALLEELRDDPRLVEKLAERMRARAQKTDT